MRAAANNNNSNSGTTVCRSLVEYSDVSSDTLSGPEAGEIRSGPDSPSDGELPSRHKRHRRGSNRRNSGKPSRRCKSPRPVTRTTAAVESPPPQPQPRKKKKKRDKNRDRKSRKRRRRSPSSSACSPLPPAHSPTQRGVSVEPLSSDEPSLDQPYMRLAPANNGSSRLYHHRRQYQSPNGGRHAIGSSRSSRHLSPSVPHPPHHPSALPTGGYLSGHGDKRRRSLSRERSRRHSRSNSR